MSSKRSEEKYLVMIGGPTAVGKTAMAIEVAKEFDTEIISTDSRQIYREMNIGTAKPGAAELEAIKHHFINSHSVTETISAGMYAHQARATLEELFKKHRIIVGVGGSGLYIRALCSGLDDLPSADPELRERINKEFEDSGLETLLMELKRADPEYYSVVDRNNPRRVIRAIELIRQTGTTMTHLQRSNSTDPPGFKTIFIGLEMEREVLYERIERRMDQMIEAGLFDEARSLSAFRDHPALQTVGYTEIFDHLDGKYDRDECIRLLKRNSRRYAKRQMTWFRNQEEMEWFPAGDREGIIRYIHSVTGF